jgi:cytochrome c556
VDEEGMKSTVLVCVLVASVGVVLAQEEFDPQPIIEGRQAALRDIGAAFKNINDEFKQSQPSIPVIRQNANQIDDLVKQQKFWFPPGTGPETEIEMRAKPTIWKQPAEFKAGQAALTEQASKLAKVAAGQDLAAIKAQTQALGRTCKGCHDKYREEDD